MVLFVSLQIAKANTQTCHNLFASANPKVNRNPNVNALGGKFVLADELKGLFQFISERHYNVGEIKGLLVLKMFQGLPEVMDPAKVLFLEPDITFFRNMTEAQATKLLDDIIVGRDYSKLIELVKKLEMNRSKVFRLIDFIASSPTHRYQTQKYGSLNVSGDVENQKPIKIEGVLKSIEEVSKDMETRWAKNEQTEIEYLKVLLGKLMYSTLARTDRDLDEALNVAVRRLKTYLSEQTEFYGDPRIFVYLAKSLFENLDSHSVFQTLKEADDFNYMIARNRPIGIHATSVSEGLLITGVLKNSLAERVNLREGDVILDVNGHSTSKILDIHFAQFVASQESKKISLLLKRDNVNLRVNVDLSTADYANQTPIRSSIKTLPDGTRIASIEFGIFYKGSGVDFKNELIKLIDQGVKGLIVDLRGNGGGSMEDATQILRLFTNSNEILWNVEYARSVETSHKSGLISGENLKGFERIFFGPLVVLIDNASVSASELSASALKSLGKAIVVGAPQSFGKGSMQIRNEIDVGGYMLTEALFFNREGYSPQFYGVPADIIIKDAELNLSESMEKDRPNAIAPRSLFAVNESYLHVATSVISEIPQLRERSLQRQKEIEKSEAVDPVLEESFSILSDWVELLKK